MESDEVKMVVMSLATAAAAIGEGGSCLGELIDDSFIGSLALMEK